MPTTGSATFSFDDSTDYIGAPIANFTTNFGATSAAFTYDGSASRSMSVFFRDSPLSARIELLFDAARNLVEVLNTDDRFPEQAVIATGSFTPTGIPEPRALSLFAVALVGLAAARRQDRV